jgi:hypothetical protein
MHVSVGDFSMVDVSGSFGLVFAAFNTLFALLTQEDQVSCFANVARRLQDGGAFVVEAFVPDPTRFDRHQRIGVDRVKIDSVMLEATRHDPVAQRCDGQHVVIGEHGVRMYPVRIRYAWPSELDLMARLAGLSLRERWAGWRRDAFTSSSTSHVSVYGLR